MTARIVLSLAVALLLATAAGAQTEDGAQADGGAQSQPDAEGGGGAGDGSTRNGGSNASGQPLSFRELIGALLENDSEIRKSRLSVTQEQLGYRRTLNQADPELNLNVTPYSVDFQRMQLDSGATGGGSMSGGSTGGGSTPGGSAPFADITTQSVGVGVEYNQLLPTAGNLSVSLNDRFDFSMVDPEQGGSSDSVTQNPELNLQLNQPVFVNGRFIDMRLFDATQRISEIAFQAQQNRTMGTVNQRIATVAQFYVQILNLRDQVEAIRAASDATRLQLEQTRIGQEQGRTSEQQVLSIQVSLNSQQEQLLNLQYSISEAESTLARAVGLPLSEVEGSFTTLPDVELPSGDAAELAQRAVEQNPQLRSLRLQQERARLQRIQAGREGAPGLQLSFSLQPRYGDERSSDEDFGSAFSDYGNDGGGVDWNARIGLRIPLTEQTERGLRKEERALGVEQIGLDIDSLQQNVESSIENRLRRDQVLARRIELLQSDVDLQRRRLENERRRVELDTSTELDLRRLEAELVRKQNAVKQAERERFLNAVQLYSTLGAELDAVLSGSE